MNVKAPKFSIIMPTFNRAFCICTAIDSLLAQTYPGFELIIVDDGSTDDTEMLLQQKYQHQFQNKRIKFFRTNHVGVSAARNIGLQHAQNEWIGYLDTDNVVTSDFLGIVAYNINVSTDAKAFYGKMQHQTTKKVVGREFDLSMLITSNYIDMGTYVHHKSLTEELGGFSTDMTRLVDWELITRYSEKYKPVFIDKIFLIYNSDEHISHISNTEAYHENFLKFRNKHPLLEQFPCITTIVLAHNHENTIKAALTSAYEQHGKFKHEIIVSDDGSTDNTPFIIRQFALEHPQSIIDISTTNNVGQAENLKKCVKASHGKIISILEGDDIWCDSSKLEQHLNQFLENPNCVLSFSKVILNTHGIKTFHHIQEHMVDGVINDEQIHSNPIINFSTCVFDGEILRNIPNMIYNNRHVSEIMLMYYFDKFGDIMFINKPMSEYNIHKRGLWSGKNKSEKLEDMYEIRQASLAVCDSRHLLHLKVELKNLELA